MKTIRQRLLLIFSAAFVVWAIYGRASYHPQVNADWRATADMNSSSGFYVAIGRLWGKRDLPFGTTTTEWVPLFLVISDFEIQKAVKFEGGYSGSSQVGVNFSGEWIEVPVESDVPSFSPPSEPDQPNVFILHADHTLELTDLIVRTQEQIDELPYDLRGKRDFLEIMSFLQNKLQIKKENKAEEPTPNPPSD